MKPDRGDFSVSKSCKTSEGRYGITVGPTPERWRPSASGHTAAFNGRRGTQFDKMKPMTTKYAVECARCGRHKPTWFKFCPKCYAIIQTEQLKPSMCDFIESFVKEIVVMPGDALMRYTIPISQSTRKAQVLVGGGSEEFRVGDSADACRQLYARAASCRHLLKQGQFRQLNHSSW